ncbi:hypothetical protein NMY22_g6452 [Coprinellus aureogranulatus]|nr:hypothetical protein NMY22_g6452 [Coprinellus aureogranulatus]
MAKTASPSNQTKRTVAPKIRAYGHNSKENGKSTDVEQRNFRETRRLYCPRDKVSNSEKPGRGRSMVDISAKLVEAQAEKERSLKALEYFNEPQPSLGEQSTRLNRGLSNVEALVDDFKKRVCDLSKEVEALREDVEEHTLKLDAMEKDFNMPVGVYCVKEGRRQL